MWRGYIQEIESEKPWQALRREMRRWFSEMTASSRRAASSKPSSSNPVVNGLAVLHYSDCSGKYRLLSSDCSVPVHTDKHRLTQTSPVPTYPPAKVVAAYELWIRCHLRHRFTVSDLTYRDLATTICSEKSLLQSHKPTKELNTSFSFCFTVHTHLSNRVLPKNLISQVTFSKSDFPARFLRCL